MFKLSDFFKRKRAVLSEIHLVDKCLILFMIILLMQSAYSLFTGDGTLSEAGNIDVIIRTSSAAIFGYFLSANFIRRTGNDTVHNRLKVGSESSLSIRMNPDMGDTKDGVKNQIGFTAPNENSDSVKERPGGINTREPVLKKDQEEAGSGRLQIITATAIGLFCLLVLILVRDALGEKIGTAGVATVAQFRDFVSGSVGFLIGCPTSGKAGK